jgi:hypothetical protein
VHGLDCAPNYTMICNEILAYDGTISKAKSYMRDPIRAARKEIKQYSEALSDLYQSIFYLYLVDEVTMLPSCALGKSQDSLYPIRLDPNPKQLANALLPFMNIVVMKALARKGFEGLATLLGLPPNLGIHESWRLLEPGLLHSMDNSASIEEFVSLQRIVRNSDHVCYDDTSSYQSGASASNDSAGNFSQLTWGSFSNDVDLSLGDPAIAAIPMELLELLFREHDPDRQFGKLRRVTSADQIDNLGLWTSLVTINQMQSMSEIAEMEGRLSELKLTLDQAKTAAAEHAQLSSKIRKMETNIPGIRAGDVYSPLGVNDNFPVSRNDEASSPPKRYLHEERPRNESKRIDPMQDPLLYNSIDIHTQTGIIAYTPYPEEKEQNSSHAVPHQTNHTASNDIADAGQAEFGKKMRKPKRRFRPWFTAC